MTRADVDRIHEIMLEFIDTGCTLDAQIVGAIAERVMRERGESFPA